MKLCGVERRDGAPAQRLGEPSERPHRRRGRLAVVARQGRLRLGDRGLDPRVVGERRPRRGPAPARLAEELKLGEERIGEQPRRARLLRQTGAGCERVAELVPSGFVGVIHGGGSREGVRRQRRILDAELRPEPRLEAPHRGHDVPAPGERMAPIANRGDQPVGVVVFQVADREVDDVVAERGRIVLGAISPARTFSTSARLAAMFTLHLRACCGAAAPGRSGAR